jgi:LysR family transcriptional regulator, nitrogen assimilation regulatory protein
MILGNRASSGFGDFDRTAFRGLTVMQFRHLRYFVKIVEAGSFSRAATTIHVAQPALSQQIAELEERLGFLLLQRSARGVRPTAVGEVLYREASSILRKLEQLPGLVRSSSSKPEGAVSIGFASSLAAELAGPFIETCNATLSKVTLKFSDGDSGSLEARVEANSLDMAVIFEDELVPNFARKPLFRQRLYLISSEPLSGRTASVSLDQIAMLPLVLPSHPNGRRSLIERAFAAAGLSLNLVAEADALSSELSAVRAGIGNAILPAGGFSSFSRDGFADPLLLEPPLFCTCSIISSSDFPLTYAGEAVQKVLVEFIESHLRQREARGTEWIG